PRSGSLPAPKTSNVIFALSDNACSASTRSAPPLSSLDKSAQAKPTTKRSLPIARACRAQDLSIGLNDWVSRPSGIVWKDLACPSSAERRACALIQLLLEITCRFFPA